MWLLAALALLPAVVLLVLKFPPIGLIEMVPFIQPSRPFEAFSAPEAPNYESASAWFFRAEDAPGAEEADVFFVHRTTFASRRGWNAPIRRGRIPDFLTFEGSVRVQAETFAGVARIFAPKYRQATLFSFYDEGTSGERALDLAYQDVKRAFEWYLANRNEGRPIILAGHSQGTHHLERLLKELFDLEPARRQQLVCAYLVAMPIAQGTFRNIPASRLPGEVCCYVCFSTFGQGASPRYFRERYASCECANPLTFSHGRGEVVRRTEHAGGVSYLLHRRHKQLVAATVGEGVVHVTDPGLGFLRLRQRDYVVVDYHLFQENIRNNARLRVLNHLKRSDRRVASSKMV